MAKKEYPFSAVKFLMFGFLVLILIGGVLLSLPVFTQAQKATPFLDALFTSASAVCVTGLSTLDVAAHWNFSGQLVILTLIEIGGLGFMCFPVLMLTIFRRRVSLKAQMVLKDDLNLANISDGVRLTMFILKFSLVMQLGGALLLAIQFIPEYGVKKGAWFSLFHAISGFCNAGFDLLGNSFLSYQNNPYILLVLTILILGGGLGFVVWHDVVNWFKLHRRLSVHSKLAITVTVALLLLGFFSYIVLDTVTPVDKKLAPLEKISNAWFMVVSSRTAGFYNSDYAQLNDASLIITMFLMYIGGTSGSTAGGLKTTTLGVLICQMVSVFRGREEAEFDERTIPTPTVMRAFTLFFMTLGLSILAIMIMSLTELHGGIALRQVVFEVFSAIGTAGLTMDLTPHLSVVGKVIIMFLMFLGRVGIYTVGFALMRKRLLNPDYYHYPKGTVLIG